jgi:hypothetical protein
MPDRAAGLERARRCNLADTTGATTAAQHGSIRPRCQLRRHQARLALAQLPRRVRHRVLIRADPGGGTQEFPDWQGGPGRRLPSSVAHLMSCYLICYLVRERGVRSGLQGGSYVERSVNANAECSSTAAAIGALAWLGTTLITYLKTVFLPDGAHWTNERVVVFTEYRDTQIWLKELLAQEGAVR